MAVSDQSVNEYNLQTGLAEMTFKWGDNHKYSRSAVRIRLEGPENVRSHLDASRFTVHATMNMCFYLSHFYSLSIITFSNNW